jgi:hypothetical protein
MASEETLMLERVKTIQTETRVAGTIHFSSLEATIFYILLEESLDMWFSVETY